MAECLLQNRIKKISNLLSVVAEKAISEGKKAFPRNRNITSKNKVIHFQKKNTPKQQQNNNKNKTLNLNKTQQNKTVVILL